jgi:chromate transporter
LSRAGLPGAMAAWTAFTMPSAIALILFGYGILEFGDMVGTGALHGFKVVAVAVVAQAVWTMARNLCPDATRASIAVMTTIIVLAVPSPLVQVGTIMVGGLAGWIFLHADDVPEDHVDLGVRVNRGFAIAALVLFFVGLIGLPLLAATYPSQTMALIDSFYRSGSLVFGGGHVVLPLLQSEVVPPGWVSTEVFLAGYGAAQAVPGPLFTFAAFLGTVLTSAPNGVVGAVICLLAIFASSFLLVIGAMPFWDALRRVGAVRNALLGINAVVVGLLLAALYNPVWTSAILSAADFGLALAAFTLLVFWKTPAWLVVILTALGGWMLHAWPML